MNETLTTLLEAAQADPLPDRHTSSHWKHYGQEVVAQVQEDELRLNAVGFSAVAPSSPFQRVLNVLEHLSYRPVTARYRSFAAIWPLAERLARRLGGAADFGVFKSAAVLSLLSDHWLDLRLQPKTFALIGDGFGFLGALIRELRPNAVLFNIDLPRMLVFQARTLERADPRATTGVLLPTGASSERQITFVPPDAIGGIPGPIDCAINIASMQEMNSTSVQGYFTFLRQRSGPDSRFYCLNRARKEMPAGEVSEFLRYPWSDSDQVFIDEPCPFYRYFLAVHTRRQGPTIAGRRLPFVNYFDGLHAHRLVHLSPEEKP